MQYMLLIYTDGEATDELGQPLRGRAAVDRERVPVAFAQEPGVLGGAQLAPGDRHRRPGARRPDADDGRAVAETKEDVGGYYLFEADDLDAAIDVAARIPRRGGRRGGGPAAGGAVARALELEQVFHEEWGRVLAKLIGFLGDFDLAEEAAQEAFAIAAERWPRDGGPANPGAWLDDDRAQPRDRPHPPRANARGEDPAARSCPRPPRRRWTTRAETAFPDERLELIFTCCHPALASTRRWR